MKRRQFLTTLAAVAATPLLPQVSDNPLQSTDLYNLGSNVHRWNDLYISPEALQDIRNWCVDQVDEQVRREIYHENSKKTLDIPAEECTI